jgi:hypothetical protein
MRGQTSAEPLSRPKLKNFEELQNVTAKSVTQINESQTLRQIR